MTYKKYATKETRSMGPGNQMLNNNKNKKKKKKKKKKRERYLHNKL